MISGFSSEPLCATSERGEEMFPADELRDITVSISSRILETFHHASDDEIARLLKSPLRVVQSFRSCVELPTIESLLNISQVTGVSIHWILTGDGPKYVASLSSVSPSVNVKLIAA